MTMSFAPRQLCTVDTLGGNTSCFFFASVDIKCVLFRRGAASNEAHFHRREIFFFFFGTKCIQTSRKPVSQRRRCVKAAVETPALAFFPPACASFILHLQSSSVTLNSLSFNSHIRTSGRRRRKKSPFLFCTATN